MSLSPLYLWAVLLPGLFASGCGRDGAATATGTATAGVRQGVPTARIEGVADSMFTGVRVTTAFVTSSTERRCQTWSLGFGEYIPRDDAVVTRTSIEGGRFSLDAPLAWAEPSDCGWEPAALTVSFERGGREDDSRTSGRLHIELGGPLRPPYGTSRGPTERPQYPSVPDSVTVVCRPSGTVRPVAVPPVGCFETLVNGRTETFELFGSTPETFPSPLHVEARYVQAYSEDDGARYDTTALNRAYGIDH